ncbi:MAG: hypothetical protein C0404_12145 [Verrucomicrobia bacterium]|nr:hypothetical protein [Verrucomicrobiota bacterium]
MRLARILILASYLILVLVLWAPIAERHLLDIKTPPPYRDHLVRSILMIPSAPFTYACHYINNNVSHKLIAVTYPIYLALFFWPLPFAAWKPSLLRRWPVAAITGLYICAMLVVLKYGANAVLMAWNSSDYKPPARQAPAVPE